MKVTTLLHRLFVARAFPFSVHKRYVFESVAPDLFTGNLRVLLKLKEVKVNGCRQLTFSHGKRIEMRRTAVICNSYGFFQGHQSVIFQKYHRNGDLAFIIFTVLIGNEQLQLSFEISLFVYK